MYVNKRYRIESTSQNPGGKEERSLAKLELIKQSLYELLIYPLFSFH